jgi:hypothetical protein
MEVFLRPAMAAMVVVVVAVGVFVLSNHDRSPRVPSGYSAAEIEEAAREARIAFAYVGRYTRAPVRVLREDVIAERVAPAMGEALMESRREVVERALVPAVEDAVLDALFVETTPRINRSKKKEGRPE